MALRDKQQRFVEEYVVDWNATQAALRAGYSPQTAAKIGSENLQKPAIAEAIARAKAQLSEKTQITREMVVDGLLKEARLSDKRGGSSAVRRASWADLGRVVGAFEQDNKQKVPSTFILETTDK